MDRRKLIKYFGASGLLSSLVLGRSAKGQSESRNILFYNGEISAAKEFLNRINLWSPTKFLTSDVHLINVERDHIIFENIKRTHGRHTAQIAFPLLVSLPPVLEFHQEVEIWTEEWIKYNEYIDKNNIGDSCYPVSGGWWSVDGDWNPSANKVRKHIFESPNHTEGEFLDSWLESLEYEELQSIHSDHHREMINRGRVHWDYVNTECPIPG